MASSLYIKIFGMSSVLLLQSGMVRSGELLQGRKAPPLGIILNTVPNHFIPQVEYGGTPMYNAKATFSSQDKMLTASDHQNATVTLTIWGELKECVNITFTYDPPNPSIEPVMGIGLLCPENFTQVGGGQNDPSHSENVQDVVTSVNDTRNEMVVHLLGGDTQKSSEGIAASLVGSDAPPFAKNISLVSRWVGTTIISVHADPPDIDVQEAFICVSVIKSPIIDTVSDVFGWIYTIVWDISFLPQIWLNWRRKSVEGYSLDHVSLNILAYTCYALFNVAFFAMPLIKHQFQERYPTQVNHVRRNDVFFATYALGIELVLGIQCCVYKRAKGQRVSKLCKYLLVVSVLAIAISSVLAATEVMWWIDVFYLMSYMKLAITPLKYIPQLYVNYRLKSTEGFSMLGVVLDITGGSMSLAQMFMLAANNNDWLSIFTNFSKFGLGVITIIFDILFFIQHFQYQHQENKEDSKEASMRLLLHQGNV